MLLWSRILGRLQGIVIISDFLLDSYILVSPSPYWKLLVSPEVGVGGGMCNKLVFWVTSEGLKLAQPAKNVALKAVLWQIVLSILRYSWILCICTYENMRFVNAAVSTVGNCGWTSHLGWGKRCKAVLPGGRTWSSVNLQAFQLASFLTQA